jgi:tetratricopeptide (TPR) repeat protein
MHQIMNNEHIPISLRLSALTMLAEHPDKRNLALIKRLLASRNDEIRLFSFSVVDGVEHEINEKIHKALQLFENREEGDPQKIEAAEQLAYLYWELVYLELADEVLTDFLLQEVERYARYAVEREREAPRLYILLGRVAFERRDLEIAKNYFEQALERGRKVGMESIDYILPYLAEIANSLRNFTEVRRLLEEVKNDEFNANLHALKEVWVR